MINWTDEQKTAIINKDKNLLVSAAAGSGKTAVLVERIIDTLIGKKINIDEFLIVTFTNAAARDMKKKIQESLIRRLDTDISGKYNIRKQIYLLNISSISTIHAFCTKIIRKYYYFLDIDPNFSISSIEENEILFNEALEEVLEKSYEDNSIEFQTLVDNYSETRGDSMLEKLIKDTYSSIQSFSYPLKWLEESVDLLRDDDSENLWLKIIKEDIYKLLKDGENIINDMERILDYEGPASDYIDNLKSDKDIIQNLKKFLYEDMNKFINYFNNISYKGLPRIPKKKQDEICSIYKEKRDLFKKLVSEIEKIIPKDDLYTAMKLTKESSIPMKGLLEVIQKVDIRFKELKNDRGLLDFNDLEHYALELLDYEEVSNYYKSKYKYIYIDEYQDSNEVQETIIQRIKRINNLFMVGDVKQSIYRFRQADPTIFMNRLESYKSKESDNNMIVNLNKNFRSRLEILNCINYLFKNIMSKDLGEIDYEGSNYLYEGIEFERNELSSNVELNIFNKKVDDEEDIEEELLDLRDIELEAKITAERIKELIGSKTYSREEGWREVTYKDIVILLRATKGAQEVYDEIFTKENIPLYSDSNEGYFDTVEIKIIINLLKLIDNFKQDIPLMSVMRSMIGGFSIEEMIEIRRTYKKIPYNESVKKYCRENENSLSNKINELISKVDKWRDESRHTSLNKLIWNILIETNYYYFSGMLPKGKIRQGNLKLLVDKAYNFERTKLSGLVKFLQYIDKVKSSSKDMGSARVLGENDNVVRLMSIHKSKGLEFPIVIIPGLNRRFNLSNSSKNIIVHGKCRLAPKYFNIEKKITKETLPRLAAKSILKKEDLSEEMRVLYVGMTRAIDKLVLIGTVKNIENKKEKWKSGLDYYSLYSSISYLDWIGKALYGHKDGEILRDEDIFENIEDEFNSSWKIKILEYDYFQEKEDNPSRREQILKDIISLKNNKEIKLDKLDKLMKWEYPYKDIKEVPPKVSVTELNKLRTQNYEDSKYSIPNISNLPTFKEKSSDFTGQEIGTITHFVMQMIRLKKEIDDVYVEDELSRMVIKKQLTEEEAEVVDVKKITRFYNSEIGKRMLSSKKVFREEPFIIKKESSEISKKFTGSKQSVLVQGVIDCYFQEDDEIVLIDYKTDSLYNKKTEDILNIYKDQIKEYRLALETLTEKKVKESYIYLLSADKLINVE
jgi:ATP-dependent helicase/nuclease subunit A